MHTTKTYIYDESIIELAQFKAHGTNVLEIWVESDKQNTKTIVKRYEISLDGRVKTLHRYEDEWTLYPPLNFANRSNTQDAEFSYLETLFWNDRDQLEKVEVLNNTTRQVTLREYHYEANKLARIEDQSYVKQFFYSDDNVLTKICTTLKRSGVGGIDFQKLFVHNAEGQITEKTTKLKLPSKVESAVFNEIYSYNDQGQLISAMQYSEGENEVTTLAKFEYLKPNSDRIACVSVEANGVLKHNLLYKYNDQGILQSAIFENDKGLNTITTYTRA